MTPKQTSRSYNAGSFAIRRRPFLGLALCYYNVVARLIRTDYAAAFVNT